MKKQFPDIILHLLKLDFSKENQLEFFFSNFPTLNIKFCTRFPQK